MLPPDDRDIYPRMPVSWVIISAILILVGAAAFLYGASGDYRLRTWQIFTVNYVFWAGLAFGGVLFSAVLNLSKAVWGRPIKRLAESFGAYLPVSFLLFWVLWPGKEHVFPWIENPVPGKQAFLNAPFMFAREGISLFALTVLCLVFVYFSVKADRQWLRNGRPEVSTEYPWTGLFRSQWRFSAVLPAAYAFILSLFAVDLIMSLSPEWYSTLFPGYYFIAAFYSAIAAIYLFVLLAKDRLGLKGYLLSRQFHDLGKLTFGFAIFTGYLFYAQLLVIWYGNLPEETRFVILRTKLDPWKPWAWAVLFMIFVIPFLTLLSRKIKIKRIPMMIITIMVLIGLWMERFLLVVPSLWEAHRGYRSVFSRSLSRRDFSAWCGSASRHSCPRVPIVPVSDPLFHKFLKQEEGSLKP